MSVIVSLRKCTAQLAIAVEALKSAIGSLRTLVKEEKATARQQNSLYKAMCLMDSFAVLFSIYHELIKRRFYSDQQPRFENAMTSQLEKMTAKLNAKEWDEALKLRPPKLPPNKKTEQQPK